MLEEKEASIRLMEQFTQINRCLHRRRKVHGGLRFGEIGVLRCIRRHADPVTGEIKPSQISQLMGLRQPSITPALRSLEEQGYVRRRTGEKDRREVFYSLTEREQKAQNQEQQQEELFFAGLAAQLGEQNTRELNRLLGLVTSYLYASDTQP